jgi:hypothetical protein
LATVLITDEDTAAFLLDLPEGKVA